MAVQLHLQAGLNLDPYPKNTLFGWGGAPQNGDYSRMYPWMSELATHLNADGQQAIEALLASLKQLSDHNAAPEPEMIDACEEQMEAFKRYISSLSLRARGQLESEMGSFAQQAP